MAGQAHREPRVRGRSARVDSSWPATAAASGEESGSATETTTSPLRRDTPAELRTRSTYGNLLMRGLAPDEAANLTAYLAGIAVGEAHWTIRQINQLLFLRQMNRIGQFVGSPEPAEATDQPAH